MTAQHGPSLRVYLSVFTALMAGTALTVSIAFIDLGPMNNVAMLGIAVLKATIVVLYFMHVRYGPRLVWVLAVSGFVWLGLLISFTLSDVLTRTPVVG